jgi:uncharacterized membrane protein
MALNDLETGIFDDRRSAEDAVERLRQLGYGSDDISVLMHDKAREKHFAEKTGTHAAQGTVTGAVIGGGLGAIVAGLTATGSIAAIVGTGGLATPLVAGPLAAALAGLGAGAAAGGIVGALIGVGIPEHRARSYQDRLDNGAILIGVQPRPEDLEEVRAVLADRASIDTVRGEMIGNELPRSSTPVI